ncbi:hypothetical protein WR25_12142 [Diploscapter pachys]|uniref:Uncharacterized protein n=1 Tax=Diploscapter pachys TaxID=2018661 RepID=A0A2A2M5E7_9BILA|nr:hypothetical protein WR25_12142 [Diploscapter pachys]
MQLQHRFLHTVCRHAGDASALQVQAQRLAVHRIVVHHQYHGTSRDRRTHPGQCLALGVTQYVFMLGHGPSRQKNLVHSLGPRNLHSPTYVQWAPQYGQPTMGAENNKADPYR